MKKLLTFILFTFIFCMQFSMNFAMEQVTQFMQETSKQFEEYSWWIKAPVLIVGTYAFTKGCDSVYARMFGKKAVTQQEMQTINQQLITIDVRQRVDTIDGEILNIKNDILDLKNFASQSRHVLLGKIRKKKQLKRSIQGFDQKLDLLLSNVELSPRKRHSWGEISPRTFDFSAIKDKRKSKDKKKKKRKEKSSTINSLSPLDKLYRERGLGTDRDTFTSDTDSTHGGEGKGDGEKFP